MLGDRSWRKSGLDYGDCMRIKELRITGHPVLGDLCLDFCKETGEIYKNIVLVGENGSGKTTILDILSDIKWLLFDNGNSSQIDFEKYNFDIEATILLSEPMPLPWMEFKKVDNNCMMSEITIKSGCFIDDTRRRVREIKRIVDLNGNEVDLTGHSTQLASTLYIRGSIIYSKAGINYKKSDNRLYTTNMQLDSPGAQTIKSDELTCDKVNNVIASIFIQDAIDAYKRMRKGESCSGSDSKIKRFVNAYKAIFGDSVDIVDVDKNNDAILSLNGQEMSVALLSSGQKQVVFRAGDLLRDRDVLLQPIVLIDEPEISLHPKWQKRIYGFYKHLFVGDDGEQRAQIFAATHSEYVLHDAMNDPQSLILALDVMQQPRVIPHNAGYLSSYGKARYEIFRMPTIDYHDELWANLMEEMTITSVNNMDKFLSKKISGDQKLLKHWQGYKDHKKDDGFSTGSLPAYIRNYSHHPEYTKAVNSSMCNEPYTEDELIKSIELMRFLIDDKDVCAKMGPEKRS